MKTFKKTILARTLAVAMLTAASSSALAVNLTANTEIQPAFIPNFPTTAIANIMIDPTNLASSTGSSYNSSTNEFESDPVKYCVFGNVGADPQYNVTINADTSRLTGAESGDKVSYTLIMTDRLNNAKTFVVDKAATDTALVATGAATLKSTRNFSVCKDNASGTNVAGGGEMKVKISEADWGTARADSYAASISLTVSQV